MAETSIPVSRDKMARIKQHRLKLCQHSLLKDGDTKCIFAGFVDLGEGNETAVAVGQNGTAFVCDIGVKKSIVMGQNQKNTTLLHLLCQSRLKFLEFLLKRYQKREPSTMNIKRAIRALKDSDFKEVASFLLTTFIGIANVTDHVSMTPLDHLIQRLGPSVECLRPWLYVFNLLTPWPGNDFVRSVVEKICQIQFVPKICGQECYCEVELFKILWNLNKQAVERYSFRSAVKFGNFRMMTLFLRMFSLGTGPSLVVTKVTPDLDTGGDQGEPILVYLVKSNSCRQKLSEDNILDVIRALVKLDIIDINDEDCDGLNAVFYAAHYKLRKVFHFLINHEKFKLDWTNASGDSLEQLFAWSDIGANNPAAVVALRKKIYGPNQAPLQVPAPPTRLTSVLSSVSSLTEPQSPDTQGFETQIQSNFTLLCDNMDVDGPCLDKLVEQGVVPLNKLDVFRSEKSRRDKVRRVLTLVLRSGKRGQSALLKALRYSGQEHLADALIDKQQWKESNSSLNTSGFGVPIQPESCAGDSTHTTLTRFTLNGMAASQEVVIGNAVLHSSPHTSVEDISFCSNDRSFSGNISLENAQQPGPETLVSV